MWRNETKRNVSAKTLRRTAGAALAGITLLVTPPSLDAQGLVEYADSEKGLALTLSDDFQRSYLDDGELRTRVSVAQVAEALMVTGFGTFSPVKVVCAAALCEDGRPCSVRISRTFSVRGGQTAPAGKRCISSEGLIPSGDGPWSRTVTARVSFSPGGTFDFGPSNSTLDGEPFLIDEPLAPLKPAEFSRTFATIAKEMLGSGNDGLVMVVLPADAKILRQVSLVPMTIRWPSGLAN